MLQDKELAFSASNFDIPIVKELNYDTNHVKILIDKGIKPNTIINKIVFATDFSESSFKTYLKLIELLKGKKCTINFLYVGFNDKSGLFTTRFKAALQRFTKICQMESIGIVWETTAKNLAKGIREVVDLVGGDLIVASFKNNSSIDLHKPYLSNYIFCKEQLNI